jgi:hypothetical protein
MAMQFLSPEPLKVFRSVERFRREDYLLSVICVMRARLVVNGVCAPLADADQPGPQRVRAFDDGLGISPRFGGDLAPYKPRTDVTLTGSGYVPRGGAATSLRVTLGVGDWRKSLDIIGDHSWLRAETVEATPARSFQSMPLRFENAFGGLGSPYNPWGKGFGTLGDERGAQLPIANIHPDGTRHARWDMAVAPAGFGPLPEAYLPRSMFRGTHDLAWLHKRNPLPPEDFDWAFYNVAPQDQQFLPYLRGDETLFLENLHPTEPRFTAMLPGLRPRILIRRTLPGAGQTQIEELPANFDSLHVDTDAMTVDLAWRAVARTLDQKGADVTQCYVELDKLADGPRPLAEHVAAFEALVNPPPPEPAPEPPPAPPPPDESGDVERKLTQELRAQLAPLPLSPEFQAVLATAATSADIQAALMSESERLLKLMEASTK